MKLLLIMLFFACGMNAQSLQNLAGDDADGTFDSCTPACPGFLPVACANWDFVAGPLTNAQYFSPKVISIPNCITIDQSQASVLGDNVCTMELRSNNHFEQLKIRVTDLVPGATYELRFHQRNLGHSVQTNHTAFFEVSIDGLVQPGAEILTFSSNDYLFSQQSYLFSTVNVSEIELIIAPEATEDVTTILAIDAITVTPKQGSPDGNPDPVEEVVVTSDCDCNSFELVPTETYIVSGWVKQTPENSTEAVAVENFLNSYIKIRFPSVAIESNFYPTGNIIDGWQKISGEFTVPTGATDMEIELLNESEFQAYFDDIRIHPTDSNLKSFVYDQQTHKLMAELDENNYATYYEYDREGGLTRIKKETERGIQTIQESRSSNVKKP